MKTIRLFVVFMTQKKLILSLCFAVFLINAMEKPGLSILQRNFLGTFIEAEISNDFGFFKKKSDDALISVAPLAYTVLEDGRELDALRWQLKITKEELIRALKNVIANVQRALELSLASQPQEKVAVPAPIHAPILKPSSAEPKKSSIPASKPIILNPRKSDDKIRVLYRFIGAELKGDNDYITTRNLPAYKMVIESARIALESKEQLAAIQDFFKLSEKQIKEIIGKVMQDASAGLLRETQSKAEARFQKAKPALQKLPISESVEPQRGPWPQYPSEEEFERVERIADVNFFNQSPQLITLWIPIDDTFEMVKLFPGNRSKLFALKKSGEQVHMYSESGNFTIIPQVGSLALYKEGLASRHGGKGIEQFASLKLIQTLSIQKANRVPSIQITVKPDLSIILSQSN